MNYTKISIVIQSLVRKNLCLKVIWIPKKLGQKFGHKKVLGKKKFHPPKILSAKNFAINEVYTPTKF